MNVELKRWTTCDLKVAAFLMYCAHPVLGWSRSGERVFFEFEPSEGLNRTVMSFWNKQTQVEPLKFLSSLSEARDMVTLAKKS